MNDAPTILALETATSCCSAAVMVGSVVRAEKSLNSPGRHSEVLPDLVEQVLAEAGLAPQDIGTVAVSIGPGSFTGLRVGLSFAKGFALGLGVPVVPVGTLDALAMALAEALPHACPGGLVCPLTVARRGEVFGRFFALEGQSPIPRSDIFLADPAGLAKRIAALPESAGEVVAGGEGWEVSVRGDSLAGGRLKGAAGVVAGARWVGLSAARSRLDLSLPLDYSLEPLYLKEFTLNPRPGGKFSPQA